MRSWLRSRIPAILGFLFIAALVTGGLGWVTAAVLRLEREQVEARAEAERFAQLRPVMWQLDSRIAPLLAREDSRPFNHYSTVYPPSVLFQNDKDGTPVKPGMILEPSPLLSEDLPEWMLLHFQVDPEHGWGSPQVPTQRLCKILENPKAKATLENVTEQREQVRLQMAGCCNPVELLHNVKQRSDQQRWVFEQSLLMEQNLASNQVATQPANQEEQPKNPTAPQAQQMFQQAAGQQNSRMAYGNNEFFNRAGKVELSKKDFQGKTQKESQTKDQEELLGMALQYLRNDAGWFGSLKAPSGQKTAIRVGAMVPLWLSTDDADDRLLVARLVQIGDKQACQGIVLDWPKLRAVLYDEVKDTFPEATFRPVRDPIPAHPERTMTALPVELDPGPVPPPQVETWTPLRLGLVLAWAAALVALSAVGLGGWSLLDLSERRIRFVSAVTHELRTPLTTLRLYLDMLAGGLVKEEERQAEYLQTLHGETDRLHRLVGNVLDFSRLERQRPRLEKATVPVAELIEQVNANWQGRCQSVDMELIAEPGPAEVRIETDVNMVHQILGNLIDNACKYAKGGEERRITLRARSEGPRLVLEVEDRGPGVPLGERHSIFRAFSRGRGAEEVAGGVGLGLALAQQWAKLLGGRLSVAGGAGGRGACFRLELPLA
jgi:signal transduction histidine kinase